MEQSGLLGEFLIIPNSTNREDNNSFSILQPSGEKSEFAASWSNNQTKVLLDTYKKYRSKVGTFEIRNLRKLWEIMASKINENLNTNYNASHVENRWRVVERSYKKFVDNQNKTGRGKRYFEYQDEMEDIFKGKKNVKPEVLLSTATVENIEEEIEPSTSIAGESKGNSVSLKRKRLTTKNLTMEQIRRDRKEYHRERLELEREKLEVQKKKLSVMEERNELLRERNGLLKNVQCSTFPS